MRMYSMSTRVIVKNLSRACTAEDLRASVSSLHVTDSRIVCTKSGSSRRFGFLGFKSVEDAQAAISAIHNTYIGTSKVVAEIAEPVKTVAATAEQVVDHGDVLDHGRVHVINLPHGASREEIEIFFSEKFGPVREVHLVLENGQSRGIAFVTFVFPSDAVRSLREGDYLMFQGRLLRISPAIEKPKLVVLNTKSHITDFQQKRLEKKNRRSFYSYTHLEFALHFRQFSC